MTESTKKMAEATTIHTVNEGPDVQSPFVFELPAVTDTSEGYADAAEAEAEADADRESEPDPAGGIKVRSVTNGPGGSDPDAPPEGDPGKYRGMLDSSGNSYDPEKHLYPPEKTRTGRWRKLPRAKLAENQSESGDTSKALNTRGEAQKLATLYGTAHLIPFGAGGNVKPPELAPLIDAYERYMNAHGVVETPPGLDAVLTSLAYSATVAQRPGNIDKLKNWTGTAWEWIREKMGMARRKPARRKAPPSESEGSGAKDSEESTPEPDNSVTTPEKGPRFRTTDDGDVMVPGSLLDSVDLS